MEKSKPVEGEVHEVICIGGHSFTIRYGYYSEKERGISDPIPVYPCFISDPHYTQEGQPLVTRIQDACEYYCVSGNEPGDGWCADCIHCAISHDVIGICECEQRRKQAAV